MGEELWEEKKDSSSDLLDVNVKRKFDLTLYSQTDKGEYSSLTLKNSNAMNIFQMGLSNIFISTFMINSQKPIKAYYYHF